ncbi:MAG: hypothetical protein V2A65_07625 [Candidatus Omnitrophota bacterium]
MFFFSVPLLFAGEDLRLPERIIIGEDKTPAPVFSFPQEAPPLLPSFQDRLLPEKSVPSLSFFNLNLWGGTRESLGFSFFWQTDKFYLGFVSSQKGIEPFPEAVREAAVSLGFKKTVPSCLLDFSLSTGFIWDLPAGRREGGLYLPDNLSGTGQTEFTFAATLFPYRRLHPSGSITYHLLSVDEDENTSALWPDWTGKISLIGSINPKVTLDLFVEYESGADYGNPGEDSPEQCLPGCAISYRCRPNHLITLGFRNLTDQEYEILPGYKGPGSVYFLAYSIFL